MDLRGASLAGFYGGQERRDKSHALGSFEKSLSHSIHHLSEETHQPFVAF
jgi:hypothetical protein